MGGFQFEAGNVEPPLFSIFHSELARDVVQVVYSAAVELDGERGIRFGDDLAFRLGDGHVDVVRLR